MSTAAYIKTGTLGVSTGRRSYLRTALKNVKNYFYLNYLTNYQKPAVSQLKNAGLSRFQLSRREEQHIVQYLRPGENAITAIHGHIQDVGGALVVATESRILYLHDEPLYSNFEEFSYDAVEGISIYRTGVLSKVRILTKIKTYELDWINNYQAGRFVGYVESRLNFRSIPQDFKRRIEAPMRDKVTV